MCLVKEAVASTEAQKRRRSEYYMRNRTKLLRKSQMWKKEHAAQQSRYRRRRQIKIKAGSVIPQRRSGSGSGHYQFFGPAPKQQAVHLQQNIRPFREKLV